MTHGLVHWEQARLRIVALYVCLPRLGRSSSCRKVLGGYVDKVNHVNYTIERHVPFANPSYVCESMLEDYRIEDVQVARI